ncbi:uncharacterized protein LOC118755004 [Rhagoletis pomonella]|uniref:uncharacterized protein LOC118755004 n=1 Tax=Rhagoletis pomonella TaxID=28610 RepID=UPI00177FD4EC|nr:uncharacterized protein LOC118755004 [Rhagoletis pomonella]
MFLHDHNMQTNADTVTFKNMLDAPLSLQEASDFLEELCSDDESGAPANAQALYIQPPRIEGDLSGEDSGDEDGGLQDNLCPAQLKSANKERNFTWRTTNSMAVFPIFPEANYEDCRGLSPHELFEKFFNDDLLEHICKCSNFYATHHQKRYEELNVGELRVFIGILIMTGYNQTGSFRDMWSN